MTCYTVAVDPLRIRNQIETALLETLYDSLCELINIQYREVCQMLENIEDLLSIKHQQWTARKDDKAAFFFYIKRMQNNASVWKRRLKTLNRLAMTKVKPETPVA